MIEAKIRIRQKELHDEEERMQRRQDVSSSSTITEQEEAEYSSVAGVLLNFKLRYLNHDFVYFKSF